jgi:hypothetical protein
MTQSTAWPVPASIGDTASHLISKHGWSAEQTIKQPQLLRTAHLHAHGALGRPDLVDPGLDHTHDPPASQTNWWAWIGGFLGLAVVGLIAGTASQGGEAGSVLLALWLGVLAIGAYFLPTIIATSRKHHNVGTIAVVNFFLGWTFIGWVVALAIAASAVRTRS